MPIKRIFYPGLLLLSFVLSATIGAGQGIDNLEIIPEDPLTTEDVVSVIATAWHPSQGCPIVETEFFYNEDTITVVVEHELGLATAICNSIDTTALGSYAPGTYKVQYIMISGVFGTPDVADTAYTQFTVEGVNSIQDYGNETALTVYPNPTNGNLFIDTEFRGEFAIYDILGKALKYFRIDRSPFYISTESFAPGVYFLVPVHDKPLQSGKFVVR